MGELAGVLSRIGRVVAVVGAAGALVVGVAGCGGSVPKDGVATSIKAELDKKGIQTGAVTCPADLKAEVGESVRCEFVVDGQPVDAVAKITSLQGDVANYDITTEARPVAKALLERKIGDQVGKQAGVAIDSTTCSGDLPPKVDGQATCTVTGGGETIDLKVTVTGVEGGLINFSFEQV